MTEDYALGFADGEAEAWRMRAYPLPHRPPVRNDRERGYWDARLPRSSAWSRRRHITQTWREAEQCDRTVPIQREEAVS